MEEAKRRNSLRDRRVPEEVIEKMYTQYAEVESFINKLTGGTMIFKKVPSVYNYRTSILKSDAWIFDLDGTLAHTNGQRGWYDYDKVAGDVVDNPTAMILKSLQKDYQIIFLTGRYEICREETLQWIRDKIGIQNPVLYMKPDDSTVDTVFKEVVYHKLSELFNILGVFEDRRKVVEMWRNIGVKCYQCEFTL